MLSGFSLLSKFRLGFAVVLLLVALASMASFLSARFLADAGNRAGREIVPDLSMARDVRQLVTGAHIVIEEIMAGDATERPEDVWREFDAADSGLVALTEAMAATGILDADGALVRARAQLADLRTQAEARFRTLAEDQGVGSGADEEFDALYERLTTDIAAAASAPALSALPEVQRDLGDARHLLSHGHLVVAEILGGDLGEDFAEATEAFTTAQALVAATAGKAGTAARRESLQTVAADILRLRDLAQRRYDATRARTDAVARGDERFDAAYTGFGTTIDTVISTLETEMETALADMERIDRIAPAIIVLAGGLLAVMSFAAYFVVSRRILSRIVEIDGAMSGLAGGALDTPLPDWTSSDELGSLRDTVVVFRDAVAERRRLEEEREAASRKEAERLAHEAERKADAQRAEAERLAEERARAEELRAAEQRAATEITAIVRAWASGDFSRRISGDGKEGVYADLCAGLNEVAEATRAALEDIARALRALAVGDLSYRTGTGYNGVYREITGAANTCCESLAEVVCRIRESGVQVGATAREIGAATDELSGQTTRAAATLEETAAAVEEMAASIRSAEKGAGEASHAMADIDTKARAGTEVVNEAVVAMREIEGSSEEIRKIIEVIDTIAFQTNLLALNAGVEAARAGEAGRGFAVVASEVRALASNSSKASREIAELIEKSASQVQSGVDLVNQTGRALTEIAGSVRTVSDQIVEIAASAKETAATVTEIANSTSQLDKATQRNAAMSAETNASVAALAAESAALSEAVQSFRLADDAAPPGARAAGQGQQTRAA